MTALEQGVWGVLATPFTDDLSIDDASLARLVDHYRRVGAAGVIALGVLGEAGRLDSEERTHVVRTVVDAAAGLPVVAGVTSTSTAPAAEEARAAAAAGASAVMLLVPSGDPSVIETHITTVSRACGVGVVLQDHPATTGVVASAESLRRAIERSGVVVAVKAEAPPTAPTIAALADGAVPVFGGLGGLSLLDELLAGAAGAMTGFAFPEALVETVRAFEAGGYPSARSVYAPWLPLVVFEAQQPISLAIRKEILRRRGLLTSSHVRPPGAGLPAALGSALDAHLAAIEDAVESVVHV
jgi:4-hydroxy-tetrahydrodipicolinate synthase